MFMISFFALVRPCVCRGTQYTVSTATTQPLRTTFTPPTTPVTPTTAGMATTKCGARFTTVDGFCVDSCDKHPTRTGMDGRPVEGCGISMKYIGGALVNACGCTREEIEDPFSEATTPIATSDSRSAETVAWTACLPGQGGETPYVPFVWLLLGLKCSLPVSGCASRERDSRCRL